MCACVCVCVCVCVCAHVCVCVCVRVQPPLRPHSYQANIDIWSFYLDNHLSQFPPYDTELLSEGPLTLLDMHHNFFEKEKLALMGVGGDHPGSTFSEITSLLWQYTSTLLRVAFLFIFLFDIKNVKTIIHEVCLEHT